MCDVFEEVNVAIISCRRVLLLHLWGKGIRVNGLQSASAPLLTPLAYMQKDKKQRIDQCSVFFHCVLLSLIVHIWATERDKVTFLSPCSSFFIFFPCDFQACVAVRDCFIRGIFMGGECRLSYWCSSLAFCEAQWAPLIDCARRPMMWHRGTADMWNYEL